LLLKLDARERGKKKKRPGQRETGKGVNQKKEVLPITRSAKDL